jgi:hypothetical protein
MRTAIVVLILTLASPIPASAQTLMLPKIDSINFYG